MRTPINGDASAVDHLIENHHVFSSLEELKIIVVGAWESLRSGVEAPQ